MYLLTLSLSLAAIPATGVVWAPQAVRYPVDPEAVVPADKT